MKSKTPLKILLADDQESMLEVTEQALKNKLSDYDLCIQKTGSVEEATHVLNGRSWDLLITDGQMPAPGDGLLLANIARMEYPKIPIIMLTGTPPEETTPGIENIDTILTKPCVDIGDRVKELLGLKE